MAPPALPVEHSDDQNNVHRPNNMIIWLDKHIGQANECVLLKNSFLRAMDPTSGLYERSLNIDDIDRSIRSETSCFVQLDEVEFMFQAFDNVEKCYTAIETNINKHIFFITSGSKGKIIVPSLVANFSSKFIPEYWIYIFCGKMNMIPTEGAGEPTNDWAIDFAANVLMYDHQNDLLTRMVFEMANSFFVEAQRLANNEQLHSALQYYQWSKQMYQRHNKILEKKKTDKIEEINQCINNITVRLTQQMDASGDSVGQACSQ